MGLEGTELHEAGGGDGFDLAQGIYGAVGLAIGLRIDLDDGEGLPLAARAWCVRRALRDVGATAEREVGDVEALPRRGWCRCGR